MAKLDCHVYGIPDTPQGHAHPYAHILLPLTREMTVELDGTSHHITAQHLGFVAPGRYHHCLCDAEIIMINIPESMIKQSDLESLSSQASLPLTGELIPLIELIKAEVGRNPEGDSVRYLYYYLYDKLVEAGSFASLRYIREHFSEEISVAALARMESYNVSYFTDWFKKQVGSSPSSYIRQLRIEKAKELLDTTQYRLIDIAIQVGYGGAAAFTRAFKELCGISPQEYRKRHLREKPSLEFRT